MFQPKARPVANGGSNVCWGLLSPGVKASTGNRLELVVFISRLSATSGARPILQVWTSQQCMDSAHTLCGPGYCGCFERFPEIHIFKIVGESMSVWWRRQRAALYQKVAALVLQQERRRDYSWLQKTRIIYFGSWSNLKWIQNHSSVKLLIEFCLVSQGVDDWGAHSSEAKTLRHASDKPVLSTDAKFKERSSRRWFRGELHKTHPKSLLCDNKTIRHSRHQNLSQETSCKVRIRLD